MIVRVRLSLGVEREKKKQDGFFQNLFSEEPITNILVSSSFLKLFEFTA